MNNFGKCDVFIVTNSYEGGGAEKAMNLLADALRSEKYSVLSIFVNGLPSKFYVPDKQICLERKYPGNFFDTFRTILKYIKLVKSVNPSIILVNCSLPEFISLFLPLRFKLIIVEHHPKPWGRRIILGSLTRFVLSLKNTIWIKVSDHFEVWGLSKRNVQVIENMVDPPSVHDSGESVLRLVFIGRLENQKGAKLFLELAQSLKFPALIVGEGSLKNELRNYSDLNHMNVEYVNFQSNPWSLLSKGDLLVVPSTSEGDGLVVVEAILAKIPLIVSDICDFRRFELSAMNYAKSLEDFRDRIQSSVNSLQKFVPPDSSVLNLQRKRSTHRLNDLWIKLMVPK